MEGSSDGARAARSLADARRHEKLEAVRARARRSDEWQRARRLLSTLCLFTGHLRPAAHEAVVTFGHQGPVPTPGSAGSPEVAEIREIREQIRRAHAEEHPDFVAEPHLPQDSLRACEWLCEHRTEVNELRLQRLSTSCAPHWARCLVGVTSTVRAQRRTSASTNRRRCMWLQWTASQMRWAGRTRCLWSTRHWVARLLASSQTATPFDPRRSRRQWTSAIWTTTRGSTSS